MSDINVSLPSKPRIVQENNTNGTYEIDALYPGYGHTLGNSLRRIILSSLPGAAITKVKIAGVSHEFSTMAGVKEDVIAILLNLKKVNIKMLTDEPQILTIKAKGVKKVTAQDIEIPGQVEITNLDQHIADLTEKSSDFEVELTVERGIGYVAKEVIQKERVDVGSISLDASFTPIKRVSYEVENMRVGDRTDFNRLRINIETDGTVTPHESLTQSISIMISQLKAIVGFKEELEIKEVIVEAKEESEEDREDMDDVLKTRVESLDISPRTANALTGANIRTVGGLVRKKEEDILDIEGLGTKGLLEIKKALQKISLALKA
jgi:DNA-directed RNA polymerase subunit alpha